MWFAGRLRFSHLDTPELREYFGSASNTRVKQSAYSLLRCIALINTHSDVILDAQVGVYCKAETPLAEGMLDKIPDRSIILLERNFWRERKRGLVGLAW